MQSYQSAQIFEAIGISRRVIDEYFTNTISRVEGVGLEEIERQVDPQPLQGLRSSGAGQRAHAGFSGRAPRPAPTAGPHIIPAPSIFCRNRCAGTITLCLSSTPPWWTTRPRPYPAGLLEMQFAQMPLPLDEVKRGLHSKTL